MIKEFLENKRILILGFGLEGKSTYNFIRKHFPDKSLAVSDKAEIKDDTLENVEFHTGENYTKVIPEYDIVIKSPGVVLKNDDFKNSGNITSQTDLFLKYYSNQTIGITGTKGKSTAAFLVYNALLKAQKDALLIGNMGSPAFDSLDKIKKETLIVYELSSHQLEYVNHSPHISALLNIYEEHLDHYGSYEKYIAAKKNIFKYQQKDDIFIYNKECPLEGEVIKAQGITMAFGDDAADIRLKKGGIIFKGEELKIPEEALKLKGDHNLYNIGAAYAIAGICGVSNNDFLDALAEFKPLPHRLEFVAEINGVKYYNDSISTICQSAIQAVKSLEKVDSIILGGMDRGINYEPLAEFLLESQVRVIILMPDTGYKINNIMKNASGGKYENKKIISVKNLKEAVQAAEKETAKGALCLFSPAAPSYGFFRNFEERGNEFKRLLLEK